jgi:hypothetical protein
MPGQKGRREGPDPSDPDDQSTRSSPAEATDLGAPAGSAAQGRVPPPNATDILVHDGMGSSKETLPPVPELSQFADDTTILLGSQKELRLANAAIDRWQQSTDGMLRGFLSVLHPYAAPQRSEAGPPTRQRLAPRFYAHTCELRRHAPPPTFQIPPARSPRLTHAPSGDPRDPHGGCRKLVW